MQQWPCISWDHDTLVPAAPGRLFCARHAGEEPLYWSEVSDLAAVWAEVLKFDGRKRVHADRWKDVLESAVRWYLGKALVPLGVRCAGGYRQTTGWERQLDVVALRDPTAGRWSIDLRVVEIGKSDRLLLHVEVAYRSGRVAAKAAEDASDLLATIRQALRRRQTPPWTALVLLGPGSERDQRDLFATMRQLHLLHRSRPPRRSPVEGHRVFPMIDAVVYPGLCYRKHDLFETDALMDGPGDPWPVYLPVVSAEDVPLRGLAIARAYMKRRLRVLLRHAPPDSEAWPHEEDAAYYGPWPLVNKAVVPPGFAMKDLAARTELWHAGFDRGSGAYVPQRFIVDRKRVCRAKRRTSRFVVEMDRD